MTQFQTPESKGSLLSDPVEATPLSKVEKSQLNSRGEMDRDERRNLAVKNFQSKEIVSADIGSFLKEVKLERDYKKFKGQAKEVFASIAEKAPAFQGGKMRPIRKPSTKNGSKTRIMPSSYDLDYFNSGKSETAVTKYFFELINRMEEASKKESRKKNSKLPPSLYGLTDGQHIILTGSEVKPDGYFELEGTKVNHISSVHILMEAKSYNVNTFSDKDFGQILDYVWAVWDNQPTRLFVPVIFLHGEKVDLLVFTRNGWYRCSLGQLCRTSPTEYSSNTTKKIEMAMIDLWYLLTLPTNEFGHFCERKGSLRYLKFTHKEGEEVLVDAEAFDVEDDSECVGVVYPDPTRHVPLRGRMAYLYEITYKDKTAILKLSWTPINRLPEGAVYDALKKFGVEGVPEVYDSGIIEQNVFGYRVEYLILEHCGLTIDKYLGGLSDKRYACAQAQKFLSQIASCLVEASHYGILHRDVSIGNIAIKNGKAKLIDWGYGKFLDSCLTNYDGLADKWKFDKNAAESNENIYDHLTGTPLFMSIRMLFGANRRDVVDDIESLLYAILYCLHKRQRTSKTDLQAFKFVDSENFGSVRISCLSDEDLYLRAFGAENITVDLEKHLKEVYRLLFTKNGKFLGLKLRYEPKLMRMFYSDSVLGLINARVRGIVEEGQQQSPRSVIGESTQVATTKQDVSSKMGEKNEALDNHLLETEASTQPFTNLDTSSRLSGLTSTINNLRNVLFEEPRSASPLPVTPSKQTHPQQNDEIRLAIRQPSQLPKYRNSHHQESRPAYPSPKSPLRFISRPIDRQEVNVTVGSSGAPIAPSRVSTSRTSLLPALRSPHTKHKPLHPPSKIPRFRQVARLPSLRHGNSTGSPFRSGGTKRKISTGGSFIIGNKRSKEI